MAIIQRKNKNSGLHYVVRVRDRFGKWFPSQTFERKLDAQAHERKLLSERDHGLHSSTQRNLVFGEYYQTWACECRGQVSKGWKITQDQMARDYVLPHLEKVPLCEIRPQDVGLALDRARQAGLAPQTVKHIYSLLHKIFEDAVEHYGILARNPALGRTVQKSRDARGTFWCRSRRGDCFTSFETTTLGLRFGCKRLRA